MSVTRDTSHSPIGPCGPSEQSPLGDTLRHALRALSSSALEGGENAGDGWQNSRAQFKKMRKLDSKQGSVSLKVCIKLGKVSCDVTIGGCAFVLYHCKESAKY